MLRVLRRPDQLSLLSRSLTYSAVALGRSEKCDIPEGHRNSDLRSVTCHIGLNRRRDLSLREDLCLFQPGGKATVGEIFKVSTQEALSASISSSRNRFSFTLSLFRVMLLVSLVFQTWGVSAQRSMCPTI